MKVYRGYSDAERGDDTGPAMVVVVDDAGLWAEEQDTP